MDLVGGPSCGVVSGYIHTRGLRGCSGWHVSLPETCHAMRRGPAPTNEAEPPSSRFCSELVVTRARCGGTSTGVESYILQLKTWQLWAPTVSTWHGGSASANDPPSLAALDASQLTLAHLRQGREAPLWRDSKSAAREDSQRRANYGSQAPHTPVACRKMSWKASQAAWWTCFSWAHSYSSGAWAAGPAAAWAGRSRRQRSRRP